MGVYIRSVPEVSIERTDGRVRIEIPTACSIGDLMALVGGTLAGLCIVIAMAMVGADQAWTRTPQHAMLLDPSALLAAQVPLAGGALLASAIVVGMLGLIIVAPVALEMVLGREIIEIDGASARIGRCLGVLCTRRIVSCAQIESLRDVEPPGTWRRKLLAYRPMWHGRNGRLELVLADGRKLRFATVEPGTNLRLVRAAVRRALEEVPGRDLQGIELPGAWAK